MRYQLSGNAAEFYENTFVPALFEAWARRLVDTAAPQPNESVLDVGCGTGVVARTAAGRAGVVVGLDLNEAMLAVARRKHPGLRWQQGDACALPFPDDSFDLVLSQAVLMFVADRTAALREMGRVASGRVAVQVPGRLAESPGYVSLAEAVDRHAGPAARDLLGAYFAAGDPDELTRLFAAAGLTIDRFETWTGAAVLDSIDTYLSAELLPIADRVEPAVRARIAEDCRTALAPFVDATGAIAAPIEVQLVIGHRP